MADRLRGNASGQALVIVALGLVVLIAAVGLAIDGGRLFLERREAQGAADQSALAVAKSYCSGETLTAAIDDGLASAESNGYDNDGGSNVVSITTPEADKFRVVISSTADTTFMSVIGISTFGVGATAMTGCTTGGPTGPGAVYAGGDDCSGGKYAFDVSGSTSRVYGGVHANSDVNIGGGNNQFTDTPTAPPDPFTYSQSINPSVASILSNGNTFEPGYPAYVNAPGWAPGWDPTDVTAAMLQIYHDLADANGTNDTDDTLFTTKVTSITKDGVYYTTHAEGFEISSVTGSIRNVVLVAPNGPIKISISGKTFQPYVHDSLPRAGILMLANKDQGTLKCEEDSIRISGGGNHWNGILWAPKGQIEMSGDSADSFDGSMVAWSVKLNGSDLTIFYDPDLFVGEESILVLE
jgi:Flp pilus assembly protein TadG